MKLVCPDLFAFNRTLITPVPHHIIRKGYFHRKSDSRLIQRFICKTCKKQFSRSTFSPGRYQKVRRINAPLYRLLSSGVTQTRAALLLQVDPKTISRRFRYLGMQAKLSQIHARKLIHPNSIEEIQFDDLESSIHTKCKPVSVCLAVDSKSRKILGFRVNQMPAKGRLAKIAWNKYGPRNDERRKGWNGVLRQLKPLIQERCRITSDENPHYPKRIGMQFPLATHIQVPGGRGAITGQGELRDKRFDPMFSLNHTCAMLRANINRLFRRTWCTSKKIEALQDHIAIYVDFHNRFLTSPNPFFGGSW